PHFSLSSRSPPLRDLHSFPTRRSSDLEACRQEACRQEDWHPQVARRRRGVTVAGVFITFEGGDGSGKSTQARLLADWLQSTGRTVMQTREPGGTELGLELREIVLHRRGDIAPRAEALIYAADRAHHIATKVRPAIERGEVVIQDRYLDSSVAYQGAGRVLDGA